MKYIMFVELRSGALGILQCIICVAQMAVLEIHTLSYIFKKNPHLS